MSVRQQDVVDTLTGFLFCVFDSESDEGEDRSSGRAYLRSRAEARFLEELIAAPIWEAHRIGISTSDDTILFGSSLETLCAVLEGAAATVEAKPDSWPVFLGYRGDEHGPPIHEPARRESLLAFIQSARSLADRARLSRRFLHWAGGE